MWPCTGALFVVIIVLLFCAGDSDPGWPPSCQGPMRRTSGPFVTFALACPGVSLLGDFHGLCCHGKDKVMEERTGQSAGGRWTLLLALNSVQSQGFSTSRMQLFLS